MEDKTIGIFELKSYSYNGPSHWEYQIKAGNHLAMHNDKVGTIKFKKEQLDDLLHILQSIKKWEENNEQQQYLISLSKLKG
jgi:hypothetical protein